MKKSVAGRWAVRVSAIAVLVALVIGRAETQDPSLKSNFGQVTLKAGFLPDPHSVKVIAGGDLKTNKGAGFNMYVSREPDYKLFYTAGAFALTIYAESQADTTLLINLPDGSWVSDDDSGGNLNPLLKFAKPMSGRYDIWVGLLVKDTAPAVLKITELK